MKVLSITLLLSALMVLTAEAQEGRSLVETLNGTFSLTEHKAATDSLTEPGSAIYIRSDRDFLLVAIKSDPVGVASLCIGNKKEVSVLHASAALGKLKFYPEGDLWHTTERFEWSLRDTTMSPNAVEGRLAYLDEHGWVASTSGMGHPNHTEFLIRQSALPAGEWFLSLGIMPGERPDEIIGLPEANAGDCASGDLVRGIVPAAGLSFDPAAWMAIKDR